MALVNLKSDLTWYGPAPAVNYFDKSGNDASAGATGFTTYSNSTNFIGIKNSTYTYPSSVVGGRLMNPGKSKVFPGPQNFMNDLTSGATGFTLRMADEPITLKNGSVTYTQFLGVDTKKNTYAYPGTVLNKRLMKPAKPTSFSGVINSFPGPINGFDDWYSGAKGFTLNMVPKNGSKLPSQFLGINSDATSYVYPMSVIKLHATNVMQVPMKNSKYDQGTATLSNQLGTGSPFRYWKNGSSARKTFTISGYWEANRYNVGVQSIKNAPELSPLYKKATETNSPSAIDEQYKKFNLQDESFNTTYIKHPLILRGIQRKNNQSLQRWGFGIGFDDGLIRGGATTVAERAAVDGLRLLKWVTSPKGLLWSAKQVGLQFSNPKVETVANQPIARLTRSYTGVGTFLSAVSNPIGIHYTRHGVPFLNIVSDYGMVSKVNNSSLLYNDPIVGNRLLSLRAELGLDPKLRTGLIGKVFNLVDQAASVFNLLGKGMPIASLSGLGGAQSVYGVGATVIRRYDNTIFDAVKQANKSRFSTKYSIFAKYASDKRAKTGNINDTSISDTLAAFAAPSDLRLKETGLEAKLNSEQDLIGTTTPYHSLPIPKYIDTSGPFELNPIKQYMALSYGQIRDLAKTTHKFNDFRNRLTPASPFEAPGKKNLGIGDDPSDKYSSNNLESKYGFGDLGRPGADRTNPYEIYTTTTDTSSPLETKTPNRKWLINQETNTTPWRGDKVNALDFGSVTDATSDPMDGVKDLIDFYFEDGNKGKNVLAFRALLTGLSENFQPGWDKVSIMGRPEGAYIYTSFERSVSFSLRVAALSRAEMIPIWRKLNYLASYTMPEYNSASKVSGPFMRLTIGDMFKRTPGFIESLSYTVPDDISWEINDDGKLYQMPTVMDVSVTYTIIADKRPQYKGTTYTGLNKYLQDSTQYTP